MRENWVSDRWTDLYFKLGKWQRYFDLPVKRSIYRANCARGLGLLGAAASEAEPALLKALKDKDPNVRYEAAEALGRIASDKSRVAPSLIAGLASPDQNHRLASIIGLIKGLAVANKCAAALSRIALGGIEPENPHWIEHLVKRLDRVEGGQAFSAASELGKRGVEARGAVGPLRRLAESASDWRTNAMAPT